jgi:CTP synthase
VHIRWVDSEQLTDENTQEQLQGVDGVLVPGGFGDRGVEGMISAVRYAREQKVPYFGICLGMQMAVVEFARHVAGLEGAHSSELADTPYPVIDLMPEQRDVTEKGGTMRLGAYPCKVMGKDTFTYRAYGEPVIYERHRHRYEFNNLYRDQLTAKGLRLAGLSPSEKLVEIVELPDHPWFVGAQFHPEFKSRPNRAHPLFRDFIGAAKEHHK